MKVVIAEKRDQAVKLAAPFKTVSKNGYLEAYPCQAFPKGAYFVWAIGHLVSLAEPEDYDPKYKAWSLNTLPILPTTFRYKVIREKAKQFNVIKKILNDKNVSEIIIATDSGREGEAIGRLIVKLSGARKPVKRLWTSSLTEAAVLKAFQHLLPAREKDHLYAEAISRAHADWLVGINTSRVYTLLMKKNGLADVFSTGRVQTPLLALIVRREEEIRRFTPQPYWEVFCDFLIDGRHSYRGKWSKGDMSRLNKKEHAEILAERCAGKQAVVKEVTKERKAFKPPLFFSLSSLQTLANRMYKYSPETILDACQALYVKGYISYPRSDSRHVTREEAKSFPAILDKLKQKNKRYAALLPAPIADLSGNRRYVDASKVTDHYAIIPTEQVPDIDRLPDVQAAVYDLIAKSLIAAHYDQAVYDYITVQTLVDGQYTFQTKGRVLIQEGWKKVIASAPDKNENAQDDEQEFSDMLPPVSPADSGCVTDVEIKEGKTKPPKRYSEGDLITVMKTAGKLLDDEELEKILTQTEGLGTEATRSGMIKTLKDRKYIQVRKNLVYPTEKGTLLIRAIGDSILSSAALTARWEQRLREIGAGQADAAAFVEQAKKLAAKLVADAIQKEPEWNFAEELQQCREKSAGQHVGKRKKTARRRKRPM